MDHKEILLDTLQCAAFFDTVEQAFDEDQLGVIYEAMKRVEKFSIPVVRERNWFEKLPLHWRYIYYLIGGIAIGYLLNYVL